MLDGFVQVSDELSDSNDLLGLRTPDINTTDI